MTVIIARIIADGLPQKSKRTTAARGLLGGASNEREATIINPETKLQNQIIVALCQNGCVARNHTVGQFYTKYGAVVNVGQHGESDIFGHRISDGKAIYIEVKLPGEEPRQDQERFLKAMRAAGAIAGCAHSIEEALALVSS